MEIVTITLNPCIDKTLRVERVMPERKLPVTRVRRYPGGGGINVARVIGRLGGSAQALWSCGGSTGKLLAELLDREDVSNTPVPMQQDTRENLIITDESSDQQYRLGLPGPGLTPSERSDWQKRLHDRPRPPRFAVFSGSLPEEVPPDWYAELLRSLPPETKVVVDTKRGALAKALEIGVYLIKPNVHELEEVVGRELGDDEQIVEAGRELIRHGGAESLLVSLGRGGAILVSAEDHERLSAPAVKVRSKVGAGDSMVGGLVFALARGLPMGDSARMAIAAGAAAVMTEGTDLCRREDVERIYEHMRDPD